MSRIAFTVPGDPVPWERVQSRRGQRFTAPRTRAYQKAVRAVWSALHAGPLVGPVRVRLAFHRATKRRCDWDNLAKTVCDALNGLAWLDDAQIVEASVMKLLDRGEPRAEVEVEPLSEVGEAMLRADRQRAAHAELVALEIVPDAEAVARERKAMLSVVSPKRRAEVLTKRAVSSKRDFR